MLTVLTVQTFPTVLAVLTLVAVLRYTVLYYGAYRADSSTGLLHYNIQLAYFFTIAAYMVLCGAAVLYRSVTPREPPEP